MKKEKSIEEVLLAKIQKLTKKSKDANANWDIAVTVVLEKLQELLLEHLKLTVRYSTTLHRFSRYSTSLRNATSFLSSSAQNLQKLLYMEKALHEKTGKPLEYTNNNILKLVKEFSKKYWYIENSLSTAEIHLSIHIDMSQLEDGMLLTTQNTEFADRVTTYITDDSAIKSTQTCCESSHGKDN